MRTNRQMKAGNPDTPYLPSSEVQELMGKLPGWIVRWGTLLFLLVFLFAIVGSWYFRYPDVVRAKVTITTENPPIAVMARSEGRIQHLFVNDTQYVSKDQVLAIIENPAVYTDVEKLIKSLSGLTEEMMLDTVSPLTLQVSVMNLGEIQPDFAKLANDLDSYSNFIILDYYGKKLDLLGDEIKKYKVYYSRLTNQRNMLERELILARRQFTRDSLLYDGQVISVDDYEQSESEFIKKNHNFEQSRVNLSEATIQISQLEQEVLDLKLKKQEELNMLKNQLVESFRNLRAAVAEWELKYVLKSPDNGYVSLSRYWSEGQFVSADHPVMVIVPKRPGELIGRLQLSLHRSGKVKPNQKVLIRLENYPYLEFGMLQGVVANISLVPDEQEHIVEIKFPVGLKTNYGTELEFRQEMTGTAEIITDERPLLLRILEPFKSMWEKNLAKRNR